MEPDAPKSAAILLATLPAKERKKVLAALSPGALSRLRWEWKFWARPNQIAPKGNWQTWLLKSGRGFGKNRSGAEWIRHGVERQGIRIVHLVGATAADVRDTMIEGPAGILSVCPPNNRPKYEPSKRRLTWPNGAIALAFSAEKPARLRGPQCERLWADELAAWERAQQTWDMAMFGLRLGKNPQACVTTTPRPIKIIRDLESDPDTVVTTGSTYENRGNLAAAFFKRIVVKYEGTRLGRQEIWGETLKDVEGALWSHDLIDRFRAPGSTPDMKRIVVSIDPATTSKKGSDDTGIIVAGVADVLEAGEPREHGFILDDLTLKASPNVWGRRAVKAYHDYSADRIVAEVNQGGDMVETIIRSIDANVSYQGVHATRGKIVRAEPVAALYEQGRLHHTQLFRDLEDQMCNYSPLHPGNSPDNMDAMVWAITDLMLQEPEQEWAFA